MFWNDIRNLSTGKPADGVLGAQIYEPGPTCCGRIKVDTSGRLWVTGFEGRHVLDVYQLPLTERSVPILSLTPGSSSFAVLGTEERITLGDSIHGVQPIGKSEFVWLSDTDNHRVVRVRNPLTNPIVDVILGQVKPQGTKCNRHEDAQAQDLANRGHEVYDSPSPSMICFPGALSLDRFGNLYVSDHTIEVAGNYRLLVFSADLFHPEDSQTLFAPLATKVFSKHRTRYFQDEFVRWRARFRDWSVSTWEPTFDSRNRMVVGYNAYGGGRFVGFYEDPLSADTNPSGYLYDFSSQPYSATFDEDDNLYIGDINRGRVLIYWNPFNNTPQPAKPVAPQESAEDRPLPAYPVTIKSVTPSPPYCVMRQSSRSYETTVEFEAEGITADNDLALQFRRIPLGHLELLGTASHLVRKDGSRITVDIKGWRPVWEHVEKVTLTVRLVEKDGTPISNWSPAFILADNAETCGIALPTPTPTPSPSPTHTSTPTATPTHTPTPTPSPTPTHTSTPTATPTHTLRRRRAPLPRTHRRQPLHLPDPHSPALTPTQVPSPTYLHLRSPRRRRASLLHKYRPQPLYLLLPPRRRRALLPR